MRYQQEIHIVVRDFEAKTILAPIMIHAWSLTRRKKNIFNLSDLRRQSRDCHDSLHIEPRFRAIAVKASISSKTAGFSAGSPRRPAALGSAIQVLPTSRLRLNDARSNEEDQFGVGTGNCTVFEQVAKIRDISEQRHLRYAQ